MTVATSARATTGHPVGRVAAALAQRPGSVGELARRCGLSTDEAQTALAVLESIGRARCVPLLGADCAPSGCSGCVLRSGCAGGSPAFATALQTWLLTPSDAPR